MEVTPPIRDVFPSTPSLLQTMVAASPNGWRQAAQEIMALYAHPMSVYFRGSSFRTMGGAEDIVQGFFADRLARPMFLADWIASRKRLRHWLLTAFKHYMRERLRQQRRDERVDPQCAQCDAALDPETRFHREVILATLRQAMHNAHAVCAEAGQEDHWRIFLQHQIHGHSFAQIAEHFRISPKRCKVMSRTAANKMRHALRELVTWPGATMHDVDEEIRAMMEVLRQ